MIEFIKDYGIEDKDFNYIMQNLRMDIIETISLSEIKIKEVLEYYNSIGLSKDIAKIIINRPDLIIIPLETIKELTKKVDVEIFVNIVKNSIEDLILLGI